jgi:hypothetical protein
LQNDQCLDWDDSLPFSELQMAERQSSKADLALCLGTSLVITPARDIPLRVLLKRKHKPAGGNLTIINLQATPLDHRAKLLIHAPSDAVLSLAMVNMRHPVPAYCRADLLLISHELRVAQNPPFRALHIHLHSVHGDGCPLPWLSSCELYLANFTNQTKVQMTSPAWSATLPLQEHADISTFPLTVVVVLRFARGINAPPSRIQYLVHHPPSHRPKRGHSKFFEVVTGRQEYSKQLLRLAMEPMDGCDDLLGPSVVKRQRVEARTEQHELQGSHLKVSSVRSKSGMFSIRLPA